MIDIIATIVSINNFVLPHLNPDKEVGVSALLVKKLKLYICGAKTKDPENDMFCLYADTVEELVGKTAVKLKQNKTKKIISYGLQVVRFLVYDNQQFETVGYLYIVPIAITHKVIALVREQIEVEL